MAVRAKHAREGELAQLVPDHRLGDEHRHVLATVVHGDRVPDHLGHDRRAARPGLDDPLVAPTVHLDHLGHQAVIAERTLLDGTWHRLAPSLPTAAHDELVRRLRLARAPFLLAPGARRMAPAAGLALAATERMVDGVHGHTANARPLAEPAVAAGLAQGYELVLGVPHLTDGGDALRVHQADLPRGKPERRRPALLREELHAASRRARHLGARPRLQLDRVHDRADGDARERERVPGPDVRAR